MSCTNPQCAFVPMRGSPIFLKLCDYPAGSFVHPHYGPGKIVYLPCGGCLCCRRERRQELTLLQMAEASLYDESWFLTLTYDDDKCKTFRPFSLSKEHLHEFFVSLRHAYDYYIKHYSSLDVGSRFADKLRFYAVGEYGDTYQRPHYHASLFGCSSAFLGIASDSDDVNFRRKELFNNGDFARFAPAQRDSNGNFFWESKVISDRWSYGSHKIYRANRKTFQYVAGYVVKKLRGIPARDFEASGRILPFSKSCRPSIGFPFFKRYYQSLAVIDGDRIVNDSLSVGDVSWKIPRIMSKWTERHLVDGDKIVDRLSMIRRLASPAEPDRLDLKRKADFETYRTSQYNNTHKEIT